MTILVLIQRHADLHRQLDRVYAAGGDDAVSRPAYRAIAREAMALEHTIIATRANTQAEGKAKRAFIEALDDGAIDLRHLIEAIIELDSESVAPAA